MAKKSVKLIRKEGKDYKTYRGILISGKGEKPAGKKPPSGGSDAKKPPTDKSGNK